MVFSGPKSFSIVEALASEDERRRLRAASTAAINDTMKEAEADMQTRVRKGGTSMTAHWQHGVGGIRPARRHGPWQGQPPDMQLHRHVFVFNAT